MNLRSAVLSVFSIAACTPKPADTGAEGSSGGLTDGAEVTSATDGGSMTVGATSEPVTSSGSATVAPTSVGDDGTSTGGDESGAVTDGGEETAGEGLPGACEAVCVLWDVCSPGSVGTIEACVFNCLDGGAGSPACVAAMDAQWSCVAGLACEEAMKFIEGTPSSCVEQLNAADELCFASPCSGEVGGGEDMCQHMQECDGLKQEIVCEGGVCTCLENGEAGAQCPEDGLCVADFAGQRAAIEACCGWTWE